MDPILIASVLASLALFLLFSGVRFVLRQRSFEIAGRLGQLPTPSAVAIDTGVKPRRRNLPGFLTRGTSPDLATDLARADLQITPAEFVLINLASLAAGVALGYFLFHESVIMAIVGALIGVMAPRRYLGYLQNKRVKAFNGQLGDTIVLLANSLRSGYSLMQSMETATREMSAPMSVEFSRVIREVALGLSMPDALQNMLRRVPSDDLDFMITAISINHEVGGNLAEILDTIAFTIRERVRILGEIRALTAQQRLSALVLSLLPVLLAGVLYLLNPGYISALWQSTCGYLMLGTGAILLITGYFVIRRIASIQV